MSERKYKMEMKRKKDERERGPEKRKKLDNDKYINLQTMILKKKDTHT